MTHQKLRDYQQNLYQKAIDIKQHKLSFFEAPTGFGKSVVTNAIAETIAQAIKREGKKVIVATPTNQLAKELHDLFVHGKKDKNGKYEIEPFDINLKSDIVVGKDNYLCVQNFTEEVYQYIDKNEVLNYFDNMQTNDDRLIETFFTKISIEEPHKKTVQEIISCKKEEQFMKKYEELDVSFTNFAYLLLNIFYIKEFNIKDYVLICDEAHQLLETAENILTNSFSPYRYKSQTLNLQNELEKAGVKNDALFKMLEKQNTFLSQVLEKYSNANIAGAYYQISPNDGGSVLSSLKANFFDKLQGNKRSKKDEEATTFLSKIDKLLDKELKEVKMSNYLKAQLKLYKSERRELVSILNTPEKITVYMSPSRGYPTLNAAKGDVRSWMAAYLWKKVFAFIGLSATLKTSDDNEQSTINSVYTRFGISFGTKDDWNRLLKDTNDFYMKHRRLPMLSDGTENMKIYGFISRQQKGYLDGWLEEDKENKLLNYFPDIFNGLVKGEKIGEAKKVELFRGGVHSEPMIFKKEQAKSYMVSPDFPRAAEYNTLECNEWLDNVAILISKLHENKNSLVICGGFYEVEELTKRLLALTTANIISAERNTPTAQKINRFKKEGGILIGTRNYGTGVDLKGNLLEKLFLVKLPFPIFTTKKWLDLKIQSKEAEREFYYTAYQNEMITSFRQSIGRLIRDTSDTGELYILDPKIHDNKYKKRLMSWIGKMSIVQDGFLDDGVEKPENILKESRDDKLADLIKSLPLKSEKLREYYLKNINLIRSEKSWTKKGIGLKENATDIEFLKEMNEVNKYKFKKELDKSLAT